MGGNNRQGRPLATIGILLASMLLGTAAVIGVAAAQQGEEEPNNEQSAATQIEVTPDAATEANGVLGLGDEDWFAFDAEEGDVIVVDYSGTAGKARLRGPGGTVLDAASPTIQRLRTTAPESGTYYIQLTTVVAANGDYSMNLDLQRGSGTPSAETSDSESDGSATTGEQRETGEAMTAPDGEWPDSCEEAPMVNASGTYQGTIDTPNDADRVKITLEQKGDYVVMRPLIPPVEGEIKIDIDRAEGDHSLQTIYIQDGINWIFSGLESSGPEFYASDRDGIDNSSWKIYAETSPAVVCIGLYDNTPEDADLPYEWQLRVDNLSPEPAEVEARVFTQEEAAKYEDRISSLEEQVDELQARVEELEEQVGQSAENSTG